MMSTKITAFFTALVMLIAGLFLPEVTPAKTTEELLATQPVYLHPAVGKKVYVVKESNLTEDERHVAVCLQGLVAKTNPCIYITDASVYQSYTEDFADAGLEIVTENENGEEWTLPLLIDRFRDYITDGGCTVYRTDEYAESENAALNHATVYGWLTVPESLRSQVGTWGLTVKEDLTETDCGYFYQLRFFREHADAFRKNAVIHIKSTASGLRDFAIQQGYFVCYSKADTAGEAFMSRLLSQLDANAPVLGWGETEKHFVQFLSKRGHGVIPADHSKNNSFLVSFDCEIPEQTHKTTVHTDENKHYCAIVISDGDNSQWIQNGFAHYYEKLEQCEDFPLTWTFPVCQEEFSSVSAARVFKAAGENNYFAAGGSGYAYTNPSVYRRADMDAYADMTAAAMARGQMRVITFLENEPSLWNTAAFEQTFDYYSRYDCIDGGMIMMDPDRYAAGEGKVWFSNDKPFVSVRLSLWYPGDEGDEVPAEWLKEQADIVNTYAADIHSVAGYSVINVHPWTITVDSLQYFVDCLDDDVELVTLDDLLATMTKNVPHVNAAP